MGKVVLTSFVVFLYALLVSIPKCDAFMIRVEGTIYCDTCRIQRETKISQPLKGAEVELSCVSRLSGKPTGSARARSDKDGRYVIKAEGAFEKDDICHVTPLMSPNPNCKEMMDEHKRIVPTRNIGYSGQRRFAEPLGFMINDPLPECKQVMTEAGISVGRE